MNYPLPYGWITQVDEASGATYYVDTRANPPRCIWTHPYEDEQYLNEHPDTREKVRGLNPFGSDTGLHAPPARLPQRHSFGGRSSTPVDLPPPPHKKGMFERLKAKASRTAEEKAERKRVKEVEREEQLKKMYARYGITPGSQYQPPSFTPVPRQQYVGMSSGMMGSGRRHGFGGGMAMPMLGGLAGGMLLGDMMGGGFDGGFGDGFGGGDFGGGGF